MIEALYRVKGGLKCDIHFWPENDKKTTVDYRSNEIASNEILALTSYFESLSNFSLISLFQ